MAGTATIGPAGQTLTINQASHSAIINWQQFSIAGGETTKFFLPGASSATLNRVLGGNPSAIYGALQSNGILYLINPSGIFVGPGGRIDTAGFLGSTLDVSNDEFMKGGDLHFLGTSDAEVENKGTIHASNGDVYLIAKQVTNSGKIVAPHGNVGLGAGTDILYQTAGDQHLFIQSTPTGTSRALGVTNAGTIRAASVELKAAGGNAYALAINNTGTIAASGYKKIKGQVFLTGDGVDIDNSGEISANNPGGNGGTIILNGYGKSSAGTVLNSGKLRASGRKAGTTGGTVEILGNRVGVTDQGVVDVSGDAGGGTALIGGDEHGANPAIPDADQTYLGPDATITAAALTLGNGGKIILWGNDTTQAYGNISVAGGAQGGNGGFVETSAHSLDVQTVPNISAPNGAGGTWLLDPSIINIVDGPDTGGSQTEGFTTSPPFTGGTTTLDASSNSATLNQADLLTALQNGNVTLDASSGSGGPGQINWTQPDSEAFDISSIPDHTLTLDAPADIVLSGITITSISGTGSLNLVLNSSLSGAGPVVISDSTINLHGGTLTANGNGEISSSTEPNNINGVFVYNSQVNAQGGDVNLTGNGGYGNPGSGLSSGAGVLFANDGSHTNVVQTTGSGDITVVGTFSQNVSFAQSINAVILDESGNSITVGSGLLSITGTVSAGTAGNSTSSGNVSGILLFGGSSLEATTDGGSINLQGNVADATALDSSTDSGGAEGVQIGASSGAPVLSITTNGSITIRGTGGTDNSFYATSVDGTGDADGVEIGKGTQLSAGVGSSVSITGFGGSTGGSGTYSGSAGGVEIGGDDSGGTVSLSVTTGGSLSITGTGGTVFTTNAPATTGTEVPGVEGVSIGNGSDLTATNTGTITIMGTGGTIVSGANDVGESFGVIIGSNSHGTTTVSSASGLIQITGNGGSSPNLGAGVLVDGFDDTLDKIESQTGNIEISGTGATGYAGSSFGGDFSVPSHGVAVLDDALIQTGGSGTISLTGTGTGTGAYGVYVEELPSGSFDSTPEIPSITAGGALTITGLSATGEYLNGTFTAASATLGAGTAGNFASITSGTLELYTSTLTLTGGNLTALGAGVDNDAKGYEDNIDGIDILYTTIDTSGGSANLTGQAAYLYTNTPGNEAGYGLYISDSTLETASSTQTSITTGGITIQGNGSLGSGVSAITDLAGIYFDATTVSVVNGALSITGDVNTGTATAFENGNSYSGTGYVRGVYVRDGTMLESTGSGSVSITGDTTGSTGEIANIGVDLSGEGFNMNGPDPIVTSNVSAAGGLGVTIMGTAGAVDNSPSGVDVQTPDTDGIVVEFGAHITTTGSAPITLTGTGGADQNLASDNLENENSGGISLEADDEGGGGDSPDILIQSEGGAISFTGTAGSSIGSVSGLDIDSEDGASSVIQTVSVNGAPSGDITLNGMVPDQTANEGTTSTDKGGATGVDISGDLSTSVYSIVTAAAGSVSITGTVSSGSDNTKDAGVVIGGGSQIAASGTGGISGATAQGDVTIYGDTRGSTGSELDAGVFIDGDGTMVSATGLVADTSNKIGLTITGFSSEIDGTTGTTIDKTDNNTGGLALEPATAGINVIDGAELTTSGTAPITLNGTGGQNANTLNSGNGYADPTTGATSGSYGVAVVSPVSGQTTTISAGGDLNITGTAGSSPTTGIGILLGGLSNLGIVSVTSAGAIDLQGTGGDGNTSNTGNVPNAGVGIFNTLNNSGQVSVTATGGNLEIGGTGYDNSPIGVLIEPSTSGVTTTSSTPVLEATNGALNVSSGSGIIYNATGASADPMQATSGDFSSSSFLTIDGPISNIGGLLLLDAFSIDLNAAIAANDGNVVLNDTDQFINTAGANALTSSNGHTWQVWSNNPAGSGQSVVDVDDGLTPNFIQYDATYRLSVAEGTGNGLLYSYDPAPVAITLNGSFSKTYDHTTNLTIAGSSYTLSASGLVSGDSIAYSNTSALSGTLNSKDVGTATTVSVSPSQATYDFVQGSIPIYGYAVSSLSGAATVTPATVTADLTGTVSKVYNSTTAATLTGGNYNLGGVYSGDTVVLNDPTSGTYDTKDVGTGKIVTVTGLSISGAQAGDYVLGSTTADGAVGTITPATLTASLTGTASKVYNSTTAATLNSGNYNLAGVYSGDTVALNDPTSGTYDTKDVGTGKTITVMGLSISGAQAGDYTLGSSTTSGTIGTITPASLTADLTGTVSKTYDSTTAATLSGANYGLSGVFGGDTVTVSGPTSGTYAGKDVATGITVTSATGLSLGGAQAGDYTLSNTTATGAVGTITPATVTASLTGTASKVYDSTTTATLTSGNYNLAGVYSGDTVALKRSDLRHPTTPRMSARERRSR